MPPASWPTIQLPITGRLPSNSGIGASSWNTNPSAPYSPVDSMCSFIVCTVTFAPSRESSGFLTYSNMPFGASKYAGSRLPWPGNSSHRIGRMPLFESTIFHAGSTIVTLATRRFSANGSCTSHSHG